LLATAISTSLAPNFWQEPGESFRIHLDYTFWVLLVLGAHEAGHYLACRYYRIPATLPFFIPGIPPLGTFGALIRIRGRVPNRRALFDVAAAGPLAGFAVALPLVVVGLLRAEPATAAVSSGAIGLGPSLGMQGWVDFSHPLDVDNLFLAGWVGMLFTSLNLFPVGQLDGGHVAYALSRRLHRWLAWSTLAVMSLLVAFQFGRVGVPSYLLWLAVLFWMRDRHPPLRDESDDPGPWRRGLACVLLVILVLCFMPVPFVMG